jgi:MFS family permease
VTATPAVSLEVAARFVATIERRRLPLAALFTATGASLLGRQIATIAIPWAVYATTCSLPQTGLTATCLIFPWLLTNPTGNAFAARIGHKPASIAAGIVGGITVAAMPLLNLVSEIPLATMLLVVVLFASFTALGSASRHALMPEAADQAGSSTEQVGSALHAVARVAIVVGSVLAGLGIRQIGLNPTLGIAAAFIALAAAADVLLVSPAYPTPSLGRSRFMIPSAISSQRPAGTPDQP